MKNLAFLLLSLTVFTCSKKVNPPNPAIPNPIDSTLNSNTDSLLNIDTLSDTISIDIVNPPDTTLIIPDTITLDTIIEQSLDSLKLDSSEIVINLDTIIEDIPEPLDSIDSNPLLETNPGIRIRPDINSLDPDGPEIAAYKRAIRVMKARPASDPRSWTYQAAIHGSNDRPEQRAWNNCQHQSYFFLSWHRMYLYYFERIVREASGDSTFVIPYWNYTDPAYRYLPAPFRIPSDASNPLYVFNRNEGINDGFELPGSATDISQAFSFENFTSPPDSPLSFGGQRISQTAHFGGRNGQIEQVPHNVMHVVIGGWMNDPNYAAKDPIFWIHHANIDRLWNKWLREHPARANPESDSLWMNQEFEFFDEKGNLVTMSGKEIINTADQLGYDYDDSLVPVFEEEDPDIVNAYTGLTLDSIVEPIKKAVLVEANINLDCNTNSTTVPINLNNKFKSTLNNPRPGAKPPLFVLVLEDIVYEKIPTGYHEIYLNLPEDITDPDYQSIYYVGSMGFFGLAHDETHSHHGGGHGKTANFEITKLIGNQMREGIWDFNQLNLTFYLKGSVLAPEGANEAVLERIKPDGNIKIGKVLIEQFE